MWAVKWYRGNFEIFRFIADEDPPTKIFKLENFDVDVSHGQAVLLTDNEKYVSSYMEFL